jgi:uncharacterized membrane protein
MDIDSTQYILALVRGILATVVVFLMARFYNNYLPKNTWLYRVWEKDGKNREFITKYYWLIGLIVFVANVLILLVLEN